MKNCLVTKLKDVINNDNLIKLNTITIRCELATVSTQGNRKLELDGTDYTVKILDDGLNFTVNNVPMHEGTFSGAKGVIFPQANFTAEITNKYGLTKISYNITSGTFPMYFNWNEFADCDALIHIIINDKTLTLHKGNIDSLKSNTALKYVQILGEQTLGDISTFANKPSLVNLSIGHTSIGGDLSSLNNLQALTTVSLIDNDVYGKFEDLGKATSLTRFEINENIGGSVEEFVKAQCNAPTPRTATQTVTDIKGNDLLKYVKFGGTVRTGANLAYYGLGWSSETKMWVYCGQNSDLSGNTRIYCAGFTLAEATEKWGSAISSVLSVDNWNGTGS